MSRSFRLIQSAVFCAAAVTVGADSIIVDGTAYTDVFVRQSEAMYYVQVPATGRVLAAFKDEVDPDTVQISPDPDHRAELLQQWRTEYAKRNPEAAAADRAVPVSTVASAKTAGVRSAPPETKPLKLAPARPFTGAVSGSPGSLAASTSTSSPAPGSVGEALKAQLRPLGLDYKVGPGYLFVSTPERLRHEAMEPLETRVYELRNLGAEILPKVVVRNEGGRMGNAGGYGNTGGYGGAGGRSDNVADIISRGPSAGEVPGTAN